MEAAVTYISISDTTIYPTQVVGFWNKCDTFSPRLLGDSFNCAEVLIRNKGLVSEERRTDLCF